MQTIIIYRSAAAGKSRRAEQLKDHYGCISIVDPWDGRSELPAGALAITDCDPPFQIRNAKVIHAFEAKKEILG